MLQEPLNLAMFIHRHHDGERAGAQLGSWFSEALHHITGTPDASQQKAQVDQFRSQVVDSAVSQLAPILQPMPLTPAGTPSGSSLDAFLTQNRPMLLLGGAGLILLMLLKPKKSATSGAVQLSIAPPSPPKKGD